MNEGKKPAIDVITDKAKELLDQKAEIFAALSKSGKAEALITVENVTLFLMIRLDTKKGAVSNGKLQKKDKR